ncbi:hypothetical protein C2G38_2155252 [Gigaspora rosea]|uniref:Uncharacterized protein n=1 Tax=Gigaspora rosea TaxID=44941 RepID=A0A397W414_9GLOM|nr:hypothetical protein C2G38_2155252 [Gigaspora rosea]
MDQPDLADLLYLIAITLEFISLTWTPKRPFRFNSYRPSFKSETPTFLTHANPDQYYYNIYGHYAIEYTFSYISKFEQNSDQNSTESLDISSKEQDLYSGESYYECDSDDEESEETEEESDSKFYGQEAFYQRSFGRKQIRNYRWRTNEASPTVKLKLLRNGSLKGSSYLSRHPACSYRY